MKMDILIQAIKTLSALFIPSHYAAKGAAWVEGANELIYQVIYGTLFLGWLVLLIANVGQAGLWALAWVCYLLFTGHMAYVRSSIRGHRVRFASYTQTVKYLGLTNLDSPVTSYVQHIAAYSSI